jgi:hypothetical protein
MMFFNKRKRFNGDVAVLLPAFGIDMNEAGVMKLLAILDIAWKEKYNSYEAALLVAYGFAGGLYERDLQRAEIFCAEKLQPIQDDWLKKGIVRSELIEQWPVTLEKQAVAARNTIDSTSELMKSLCLGIVGDTSRVLINEGFSRTPIKDIELLVFGMFIVTEAYTLAKKKPEKSQHQLDDYHRKMVNYVTNEYYLKNHNGQDTNDILEFHSSFSNFLDSRYGEYRQHLLDDMNNPASTFLETFQALIANIFVNPLRDKAKNRLLTPVTLKIAEFYIGCQVSIKNN